jgi:hypothetical protein
MAVNKHLKHVDELIFTRGSAGATLAIQTLKAVGSTLSPSGGAPITITTKWDGAPAVICGIDPADGKFFVGTKGVFAQTPKLAKTESDVQRLYDGALAQKLSACLRYLKPVVTQGVLQGDLLFTNDKSSEIIKGKRYITFRPNTLTYAVEPDSKIGGEIQNAELGIVFHTKYTGDSIQTMSASFGVTDSDYNGDTASVWAASASFQNVGGVATMQPNEYREFVAAVNQAEGSIKAAGLFLDKIQSGKKALQFDTIFLQFFNNFYKQGRRIPSVKQTYNEFLHYLGKKYNEAIEKNKTLDAQAKKAFMFIDAIDSINENQRGMQMVIATVLNLTKAKMILVNKMNQVAALDTFVKTDDGYKVTAQEGFVAITEGQAVKLIDRLEFSRLNFTIAKNWG